MISISVLFTDCSSFEWMSRRLPPTFAPLPVAAQQSRLAVLLGLALVALVAATPHVLPTGAAAIRHRVHVAPLDPVALAAVHAAEAVKAGRISELQSRAQLGRDVTPDVL